METKIHKSDGGTMIQTDMKWLNSRPNPVYRCQKCGMILDSTQHEQYYSRYKDA